MRYAERSVSSTTDLLRLLATHRQSAPVWFRGQSHKKWALRPSLLRKPNGLDRESALTKRFKQNAMILLEQRPQTEWEWMFVMQHYEVPTRLLDWTESPLVALYFAANAAPNSEGAVWALLPLELNALANAPLLSDLPAFDHDAFLDTYLPSRLASEAQTRQTTAAAIFARNTPRSRAQSAVFTISHRDRKAINTIKPQKHVWRYIVPAGAKKRIMSELNRLHINELSLFPELASVGRYARELVP